MLYISNLLRLLFIFSDTLKIKEMCFHYLIVLVSLISPSFSDEPALVEEKDFCSITTNPTFRLVEGDEAENKDGELIVSIFPSSNFLN